VDNVQGIILLPERKTAFIANIDAEIQNNFLLKNGLVESSLCCHVIYHEDEC
jgi:hypothetical protein